MPSLGYRKGVSDDRVAKPASVRTHISARDFARLKRDAMSRGLTLSRLLRELVTAHLAGKRPTLPRDKGASVATLRELARIGNNLNQLTRQANTGLVTVPEPELRKVLDAVMQAVARL